MDSDVINYVSAWKSRPFDGGYAALREFAAREFSGALTDGAAWLFMLNGRIVGAFDGGVEAFESADGTAYAAPDDALPLLFAMLERDGSDESETRGRYYTKDVSLAEVNETLSSGEFTGYVELSENVLSGEYYLVYYRGRRMPVAFVGSGPTLLTGDEAFERAASEVGVYEVRSVDARTIEIPGGDADADPAAAAGESGADDTERTRPTSTEPAGEDGPASAATPTGATDAGTADAGETSTRSIPALDPRDARSPGADGGSAGRVDADESSPTEREVADATATATASDGRPAAATDDGSAGGDAETADLRRRLRAVETERDYHRAAAERLAVERGAGGAAAERTEMEPEAALAGTNLFVRYASRGGATLEAALAGEAGRSAVDENLRIEYHTEFDDAGVAVDGRPFESFLTDATEYAFVEWVLRELPYEIRETGNERALEDLYGAIAEVDRIELRGELSLAEETDHREAATRAFDVIFRNRTGDPLAVANVNDSRDPATEGIAAALVEDVRDSAGTFDSLAGAFLVTTSYFEPGAFEPIEDATEGGLLDRGRRKSYVKLSRKSGYHLCFVEARNRAFYVNVPEL